MFQRVGKPRPLAFDMGHELGVPGALFIAAFAPVEDKLGHGIVDKILIDAHAQQYFKRIAIWLPLLDHTGRTPGCAGRAVL